MTTSEPPFHALVTGTDQRQGLAVLRALGTQGLRVIAAAPTGGGIGYLSRYAAGRLSYPSPTRDAGGFVAALRHAAEAKRVPLIFPAVESTLIELNRARTEFEPRIKLAMPDSAALEVCLSKQATAEAAARAGVPVPPSCLPQTAAEARAFAAQVGYPLILKPCRRSASDEPQPHFSFKVLYVATAAELERHLEHLGRRGTLPLVQKFVSGANIGLGFLYLRGDFTGLYQYRQARDCPFAGGVSCVHLSESVDGKLRQLTARLLDEVGYEGLGQIDYRVGAGGDAAVLEINPRAWAPISAALKLGLNFPYAYYRYLIDGEIIRLPQQYPTGKRCRYLRADVNALFNHLRSDGGQSVEALPGKTEAIARFLADFRPGVDGDVFTLDDPLPALADGLDMTKDYLAKAASLAVKIGRNRDYANRSNN